MAKQFSFTTDTGVTLPTAYAKLDSVKLYSLAGMAELVFQVFVSKEVRDQYPDLAPIKTVTAWVSGDDYQTYFSSTVLAGSNLFKQGYAAYDAQPNNFFAQYNAQDI